MILPFLSQTCSPITLRNNLSCLSFFSFWVILPYIDLVYLYIPTTTKSHIFSLPEKFFLSLILMQQYSWLFWKDLRYLWIYYYPYISRGIIQSPFIRSSSNCGFTLHTSTYIILNPPITYEWANLLPKYSSAKWHNFVCLILCTYYVFFLHLLHSKFLYCIYCTFNRAYANSVLHSIRHYTYLCTHAYLLNKNSQVLQQISSSTLTHVSRYRPFIKNGL